MKRERVLTLSHGAHVVSEVAVDQSDHGDFDSMVDFVPQGAVDAFVRKVESALAAWRAPVQPEADGGFSGMSFHLLRALHGIGVLSQDELQSACKGMKIPSDRMILALPEQVARYNFAQSNALPRAVPFHGLRNIDGWKGCASSYKFLGALALAQGLPRLTIYEEDATFSPDASDRLAIVEQELDARGDGWDIFSGLLSDLHSDTNITAVTAVDTEEFIDLDSVIGMVFGIYSRSAMQMLAQFEFLGADTAKHTIDRYLESLRPRGVTVWPPLAGHAETLDSTLWPVNNSVATPMIDVSIRRLGEKREEFLRQGVTQA
jgi:GR25 family glycosyltransferase involved in LPS biosynthesis